MHASRDEKYVALPASGDDDTAWVAEKRNQLQSDSPAQRQEFRLEGEFWTIRFDGYTCRLRDSRGLRHLCELLRRPGLLIPAESLSDAAQHGRPIGAAQTPAEAGVLRRRSSENARVRVTRAIASALRRIDLHHPSLGVHLRAAIRTGQRCAYVPYPAPPGQWET